MADKRNRGRRITDRITEAYYELMKIVADRKSTRLNSSHANGSYAVCCLKKKNRIGTYVYRTLCYP